MSSAVILNVQNYSIDQKDETAVFNDEVLQWAYALALPIVGLLMLSFFLSLGGAFALLGPGAIFIAARLITRYCEKKIHMVETIEIQRETFLKFTF